MINLTEFGQEIYTNNVEKGFWESDNIGEKLALVHSEISEALEGIRHGNPPDDKIPEFTSAEAELADAVIRIMDICTHYNWSLEAAIKAKHQYNLTRPFKHGKKF